MENQNKIPKIYIEKLLSLGYQFLDKIGQGGMGQVIKVYNQKLKRIEALKFIEIEEIDSDLLTRFHRETQAMANLKSKSPQLAIPEVYSLNKQENFVFYTMEYIEGNPLSTVVENQKLEITKSIDIIRALTSILEVSHAHGIIHRDLKPANIVIDSLDKTWLVDFGIVKKLYEESKKLTKTGHIVGTLRYIAPEQVQGKTIGIEVDIYSLGVVFYELLTSNPLIQEQDMDKIVYAICHQKPLSPKELIPDLPIELERICLKAIQKTKEERYHTVAEFREDLEKYLGIFTPQKNKVKNIYKNFFAALCIFLITYCLLIPNNIPVAFFYGKDEQKITGKNLNYILSKQFFVIKSIAAKYIYFFKASKGSSHLLHIYSLTPKDKGKKTLIDLKSIKNNVHWIIFSSSQALSSKAQKDLQQKIKPYISNLNAPYWSIYICNNSTIDLLHRIKVLENPFSLQMYLKKSKSNQFKRFFTKEGFVEENDQLQININVYKKCYLAIFLYDSHKKIYQLFPKETDIFSPLVNEKQLLILPSQGGFVFDASKGIEHLCFFYHNKKIKLEKIKSWLNNKQINRSIKNHKELGSLYKVFFKHK